jgi:hypothetical protein
LLRRRFGTHAFLDSVASGSPPTAGTIRSALTPLPDSPNPRRSVGSLAKDVLDVLATDAQLPSVAERCNEFAVPV